MAVAIIYETHSITTDNETGIATGWLPGRLSPRGRSLAAELGQRHRDDDLAAIFTSDLARAVETAEIAFAQRDIPIIQDPRLRECNYGSLNGTPVADLAPIRRQHLTVPFPHGQSYQDVVAQTRSFLRDLTARYDGRQVLLISHSANRWALQHLLHGIPLAELIDAPFTWQPGWHYILPTGWTGPQS